MNYKKHYDLLIERAKNRTLSSYKEKHHIVPVCIGGKNNKNNLVSLTPEEHFLAHQLLVKIYPNKSGLVFAAHMMGNRNNKKYGWIRRLVAEKMRSRMIGRIPWNKGSTGKQVAWNKGKCGVMPTPWNKGVRGYIGRNKTSFNKGDAPWNKGACFSEDVREKMSLAKFGKPRSANNTSKPPRHRGKIWITNGTLNKRVDSNIEMETGWKRGMTK